MTLIWAHAGAGTFSSSNTIEAFELAIEQGADGLELDVHMTRDGRVVCRHDETVDLPSGVRVFIRDLSGEEVGAVDLGEGRRIPELAQVLSLLAGTDLALNVEVKNGPVLYPGIEEAVLATVAAAREERAVVYSSFNHYTLLRLRELSPGALIAPLYTEALVDPWLYAQHLGADALHPFHATLAAPGVLDGFREAGVSVRAWTVNEPEDLRRLISAGVDAVITDEPAIARRIGAEIAAESGVPR
ncbi:glycerophosphodiester phosphodiesterase family protein [Microbacterium sp.]|uniref:glycerophosphodiester phosphodiesterase family protein n=1 Tax=Microbacterium sp. TaxID=51671 RepID=UPI003341AD55